MISFKRKSRKAGQIAVREATTSWVQHTQECQQLSRSSMSSITSNVRNHTRLRNSPNPPKRAHLHLAWVHGPPDQQLPVLANKEGSDAAQQQPNADGPNGVPHCITRVVR